MIRSLIGGIAVTMILGGAALAQNCQSYTNIQDGSTADAAPVMANFYCAALVGKGQFTGTVSIDNPTPSTGSVLSITPTGSNWNEGIEINPSSANGYAALSFRQTANSITGGWEIFKANTTDGTGSNSLSIASNGLTGMSGTGRSDTPFSITAAGVSRFGGAVGIGTTSPTDALDVAAPIVLGLGAGTERLSLNAGSIGFNRKVATGAIYNNAYFAYQFQHIGSASPASDYLTLQVYSPSGSNVTGAALLVNGDGKVSIQTLQDTYAFYVNGSAAGTTGWTNASDVRMKTGIVEIANPLEIVDHLRGVRFRWRPAAEREVGQTLNLPVDEPQIGFVAQEVATVVPEAVIAPKAGTNDPYSVRDSSIVPVLVEAIKAQQAEIRDMKAEITTLQSRLTKDQPRP